jgi:glucokinase
VEDQTVDVVAAVDIGGTRIKAALVDRAVKELVGATLTTPPDLHEPGALGRVVEATVAELLAEAEGQGYAVRLAACGVVVPGLVDEEAGVAVFSANLGWKDLELVAPLERSLGVPVVLGHDVRAGLLAECAVGAAKGAQHALFVPLGTGVAGALMLDGHVVRADGWAGELGHVVVEPDGPRCGCGGLGCLEAVSSASAVERAYAERVGGGARPGPRLGADGIAALVVAGDPDAAVVWTRAVNALARAVVMAITLTGVDRVLVGGGLAQSGEVLMLPLRERILGALTFQRPPIVTLAALGDRAGCLGAACLAWDIA